MLGTSGIKEILMSASPCSGHSQNAGNDRERPGTTELTTKPRQGMFFHWCNTAGDIEKQGHLLSLGANGHGTAQLFEWFFGEPSTVIEVAPDYLRTCIFYASATAMNAAYESAAGND